MSFFSEHDQGCTPLQPCRICNAVAFLKERLKDKGFQEFMDILEVSVPKQLQALLRPSIDLDSDIKILEGKISTRAYYLLLNNHEINSIRDLVLCSKQQLMVMHNFGDVSYREISEAIVELGLRLHLSESELVGLSAS